MTKFKDEFYQIKEDGNIHFTVSDTLIEEKYAPLELTMKKTFLYAVVLIAFAVDAANFYQFFSSTAFDSAFLRVIGVSLCLLGFEIPPLVLGGQLKRKDQGYKENVMMIKVTAGLFLTAVVGYFALRIRYRDSVAIRGAGNIFDGNANGGASDSLLWSIFFALVPVITSGVVGVVSFYSTDFLKMELKRIEQLRARLKERINQCEAIIALYEQDVAAKERVKTEDEQKYQVVKAFINDHKKYLEDYTRLRIAEIMGDPKATSILTQHREKYWTHVDSRIKEEMYHEENKAV